MAEAPSRKCFNRSCSEAGSTRFWNGWRLSTGEYSSLCHSCATLYEEGRFCDVFHSQAPGWVPCELCSKRIHCGCIASSQAFILLDAGGIECITCAKRRDRPVVPGNLAYSLQYGTPFSERMIELSTKNWSQFSGIGPLQWRETPNLYNSHLLQSEAHTRTPRDVGILNGHNRYNTSEVFSLSSLDKKSRQEIDWPMSRIADTSEIHENKNSGIPQEMLSSKEVSSNLRLEPLLPNFSAHESNSQMAASGNRLRTAISSQTPDLFHSSEVDPSTEAPIRNGRLLADGKGKNQALARYFPTTTNEEQQKIAGSSEIKPLFEKTLSASDAGRIGRLVVPKKCAEAYFPHISQPEGLPLKIQDNRGKEWIFQFRFWPNNNSRMYVLEGVSAYIQSMQLLAGDKVTFSRLEPEGKLVMGFRKASSRSTDHDDGPNICSNNGDANAGININLSKADKSGYIAKDIANVRSTLYRKRKCSTFSSKDGLLLLENMDLFELKITLEEAQRLIRPSPNDLSHAVMVESAIEEYEDCPVIGKPTIFTTDHMGVCIQWAQCDDCHTWRRLPADALLPAKWTCSNNIWDLERCTCLSPQDISAEQLDDLLFSKNQSVSKKMKVTNQDMDAVEALEGLDTLANVAIFGEGQAIASSGHITTKHPRHRMGCSCIVCIQPPSGKGLRHKHKPTCDCTVCMTVKRRFQTLMLRREKKLQEKDEEAAPEKPLLQENYPLACKDSNDAPTPKIVTGEGSVDISNGKNSSNSSLKGQIDLNIKPEREDPLISSDLNAMKSCSNVAEAESQLKSPIHSAVMDVAGDLNIKPERGGIELSCMPACSNVVEAEDQMKSSIHNTVMEVVRDPRQRIEVDEANLDGAHTVPDEQVLAGEI